MIQRALIFIGLLLPCMIHSLSGQIILTKNPVWVGTPGAYPTGLGWSDINNDGSPDLVVSCGLDVAEAPVSIYFNNNGTMPATPGWVSTYLSAFGCLYTGDLNNDGSQDLAVASLGITNQGLPPENMVVFMNNGGFPSEPDWISPQGNGFSCSGADVDCDGDIDLVFGQGDWLTGHLQKTKLFKNNGGVFDTVPAWETDSSYCVDDVVFGDVDMDGWMDLAIGNERAVGNIGIAIFKNNGGTLETTPSWHTSAVVGGRQMAFGDCDKDGYPELAVASPTQKFYLFDNKGGVLDTVPCWSSAGTVNEPSAVAWVDADGDGDLDLSTGSWFSRAGIFENTGGALADTFAWWAGIGTGAQQLAWCDYDGDRLTDTVFHATGDGTRRLFFIGLQPLHRLNSVSVNGIALGNDEYCYDLLNGWISLASAPAQGDTLSAEIVFSECPDMAVTNWTSVRIYKNQSTQTGMNEPHGDESGSWLSPATPNPFHSGTSFRLMVKSPCRIGLEIHNFHGKIVRRLFDGPLGSGEHEIMWDGKDQNGNDLPDGFYFSFLNSGEHRETQKLMIIR